MSIYTRQLSQLATEDLEEVLRDRAVENVRLEFKREAPDKDETLKKLSAFANTYGGFLVVGVAARSEDGRIEALPGVDPVSGYKQKVVDWCFGGATPPLTVGVSDPIPVPGGSGRVCYVVHVPESDIAPHFLNGRRGVWVRTDEFSGRFEAQLANDSELRQLFDRRRLVVERRDELAARAKRRFETYASRKQVKETMESANKIVSVGPQLTFCFVPRFPARRLCGQETLRDLIVGNKETGLNWRGGFFPMPSSAVISQHESAVVLDAAGDWSMFEVNVWGGLFYGARVDDNAAGTWAIHLYMFVGRVLLFMRHAGNMLRALGYSGPVLIRAILTHVLDTRWAHARGGVRYIGHGISELDDTVEFSITTTAEALQGTPDEVAADALRYIFFSVNWPDLVAGPQELQALVARGYECNFWRR